MVSVDRPVGVGSSTWTIDRGMLGSAHPYFGSDKDTEDRVDTSNRITTTQLNFGSAMSCQITFAALERDKSDGGPLVAAILENGIPWGPVPLGRITLSEKIGLSESVAAFDGRQLHLSGHLLLAGTAMTGKLIDLVVDKNGYRLATSIAELTLFSFPANSQGLLPPLRISRLDIPPSGSPRIDASLVLAHTPDAQSCQGEMRAGEFLMFVAKSARDLSGSTEVPLQMERNADGVFDGHFRLSRPKALIKWCYGPTAVDTRSHTNVAILDKLVVFPEGMTLAGTTRYIDISGSYDERDDKKLILPLDVIGFRIASVGGEVYPVGIFKVKDQSQVGKISDFESLADSTLSGEYRDGGNSILTLSGHLRIWRKGALDTSGNAGPDDSQFASVFLKGVTATVPADELASPSKWSFDFSKADLVSATGSELDEFYGHRTAACDSKILDSLDLQSSTPAAHRLCVGIHLQSGATAEANDIAYAIAGIADACESTAASISTCNDVGHRFSVSDFLVEIPKKTVPRKIRFGLGSLQVTALEAKFAPLPKKGQNAALNSFEQAADPAILKRLGCQSLDVQGTAEVASVDIPMSFASEVLSPVKTEPLTPTFAFGNGCEIFAMTGYFPLKLTPQSSLLITSLLIAHSRPDNQATSVNYVHVAGALTSGNITVVFSNLGFRNITDRERIDAQAKSTPLCLKNQLHETQFGNICVTSDIDWKLTSAISGVQNADQIGKILTGIGSFALGILLKH